MKNKYTPSAAEKLLVEKLQKLPQNVKDELGTLFHRIANRPAIILFWKRVLTERERKVLGDDLDQAYAKLGIVGMWQKLHGGTYWRAVIDIAHALDFLEQTNYGWLLRELGEKPARQKEPLERPVWDVREGELRFAGKVIRTVRVQASPSNIQRLLVPFYLDNFRIL